MELTSTVKWTSILLALCCMVGCGRCTEYVSFKSSLGRDGGYLVSRLCGDVDTGSTVNLTCPVNAWFHVDQKLSSESGIGDCSSQVSYPSDYRVLSSSSSSPPLTTDCRGSQSANQDPQVCLEGIQVASEYNRSNIQFFQVNYYCVSEVVNMCEQLSTTKDNGYLYLASPSFFPPPANDVSSSRNSVCRCNVTANPGQFSADALYLSRSDGVTMTWGLCSKNMTCEPDSIVFSGDLSYPLVNEFRPETDQYERSYVFRVEVSSSADSNSADIDLWIRFLGVNVTLQCDKEVQVSTTTEESLAPTTADTQDTSVETDSSSNGPGSEMTTISPGRQSTSSESTGRTPSETSDATYEITSTNPHERALFLSLAFLGGAESVLLGVAIIFCIRRRLHKRTQLEESSTQPGTIAATVPEHPNEILSGNVRPASMAETSNTYDVIRTSNPDNFLQNPRPDTDEVPQTPNIYDGLQPAGDTDRAYTSLVLEQTDDTARHRSEASLGGAHGDEGRSPNTSGDDTTRPRQRSDISSISHRQGTVSRDGDNDYIVIDDVPVDDDGYLTPQPAVHRDT